MLSIANIPAMLNDTGPEHTDFSAIDPATSTKIGSITVHTIEKKAVIT